MRVSKTLRCISLHKRSYFQILKVGCEHGRSNGSQLTPSSVTKCNGSQQCGEMGVSLNNLTSYLFSKLATLIKLHVACKLENKSTSLTRQIFVKEFSGWEQAVDAEVSKCQGEWQLLIFFGIILTALRLQSHRSIQHSRWQMCEQPRDFFETFLSQFLDKLPFCLQRRAVQHIWKVTS